MPYSVKANESDARRRLEAFWAGESLGRPALHVVVKNPDFVDSPCPFPAPPEMPVVQRELRPEYQAWKVSTDLTRNLYLAEAMPGMHVVWGQFLTTLPVVAGGQYELVDNNSWICPMPEIVDRPAPRFDPAHPAVKMMDDAYQAARKAIGGRGFITPPLMLDGLTTMAMFRGTDTLCTDLLDRPQWVRQWSSALTDLYIALYERYYRMLAYDASLCFFYVWAPGRSEGVQCDFAVNISPEMFRQFVLEDLRRTTEYFDYSLYHLDGTCQMRFLDLLRQCPRLTGIQWNPETTAGPALGWLDAFREIRRRKFSLMIWPGSVDEAVEIVRAVGPDGLFLSLPAFETVGEGEKAIRKIQAAC